MLEFDHWDNWKHFDIKLEVTCPLSVKSDEQRPWSWAVVGWYPGGSEKSQSGESEGSEVWVDFIVFGRFAHTCKKHTFDGSCELQQTKHVFDRKHSFILHFFMFDLVSDFQTWISVCLCSVCLSVAAVNQAVKEKRAKQTLRVLSLPEVQLHGLIPTCAADYQRELHSLIADRMHRGATDSLPSVFPSHLQTCWPVRAKNINEVVQLYTCSTQVWQQGAAACGEPKSQRSRKARASRSSFTQCCRNES